MVRIQPCVDFMWQAFGLQPSDGRLWHNELPVWQTDHFASPSKTIIGFYRHVARGKGNSREFHKRTISQARNRSRAFLIADAISK